jgi:DNA invertase Pin-like site-specific DNA recombinase
VAFRSLTDNIDTDTASGELFFHVFGALAQYERSLIKERVNAGLEAARFRGRRGGRPRAISPEKLDIIIRSLNEGMTKSEACRTFGVKRSTLIDSLKRVG